MRKIQNTTESDGDSDIDGEAGDIIETSGWEDSIEPVVGSKEFNRRLISLANKKINLISALKNNNIFFDDVSYSPSGWTHKRICPFPDHHDKSPSFHCNSLENRFWCFGCKKGGGIVQFLSFYTGAKQTEIAKTLLAKYGDLDEVFVEVEDQLYEEIDALILGVSEYFKTFIIKYSNKPKAIHFAESLLWCLDVYLEKHSIKKSNIEPENLEARISILKRKLDKFEQNLNSR